MRALLLRKSLPYVPTLSRAIATRRAAQEITRLAPSAAEPSNIISALRSNGAVIVEKLIPRNSITKALSEVSKALDNGFTEYKEGDFFQAHTSRASGLIGYSPTFVTDQLMNPLFKSVYDHFLTSRYVFQTASGEEEAWETPPQVNACIALRADPNAKDQILHRDDTIHHNFNAAIATWEEPRDLAREASLSMFVAGTRTTKRNGATRVVLNSHLWDAEQEPHEADAVPAEMEPGDALFLLSSCYHGGSANTTESESRVVFQSSITRGVLRQEENQFLSVPLEVIKKYPYEVQKLAGFRTDFPGLGHVDFKDPLDANVKL